jgi:hypothetical protein
MGGVVHAGGWDEVIANGAGVMRRLGWSWWNLLCEGLERPDAGSLRKRTAVFEAASMAAS